MRSADIRNKLYRTRKLLGPCRLCICNKMSVKPLANLSSQQSCVNGKNASEYLVIMPDFQTVMQLKPFFSQLLIL